MSKQARPPEQVYRVFYTYVEPNGARHDYNIVTPAVDADDARRQVEERMRVDGMPMDRITIRDVLLVPTKPPAVDIFS